MGKAQTRASNKYNARAYDRIALQVKKGERATLQQHAASVGESLNGWIAGAIKARFKAETGRDEIPRQPTDDE